MLEISNSKQKKWKNNKDKSWCYKEGEVMSGKRWPVSEGANLPIMQPSWVSAQPAPALRRDPQVIQRLGKSLNERWEVIGKPCLTWRRCSGFTLGNRSKMWSRNFSLSLAEQREEWMPEHFIQERKKCCLRAFRWISCPPLAVDVIGKALCVYVCALEIWGSP